MADKVDDVTFVWVVIERVAGVPDDRFGADRAEVIVEVRLPYLDELVERLAGETGCVRVAGDVDCIAERLPGEVLARPLPCGTAMAGDTSVLVESVDRDDSFEQVRPAAVEDDQIVPLGRHDIDTVPELRMN